MTVTLVWQCDSCSLTYERSLGGLNGLVRPPGWTVRRIHSATLGTSVFEHQCPTCQAKATAEEKQR